MIVLVTINLHNLIGPKTEAELRALNTSTLEQLVFPEGNTGYGLPAQK